MRLVWDRNAWQDYLWWQTQNRQILKRINLLIEDIIRNGNEGMGKPGPLKYDFAGYWLRQAAVEAGRKPGVTSSESSIPSGMRCRCLRNPCSVSAPDRITGVRRSR